MAVSLLVFGTSATSSQPDPVDCWSVRENNTGCVCVCVWVEGLLDDDNDDDEREKTKQSRKKYFGITLYSSFYKSAFENRVEDEVPVCAFVLISKATHSNKFRIYPSSFCLVVCTI